MRRLIIYTSYSPYASVKLPWFIKRFFWQIFGNFGGHKTLSLSVINGLKACNVKFKINPLKIKAGDLVLVISNINALKYCIQCKGQRMDLKLIAGPLLFSHPSDFNYMVRSPEIDLYLVAGEWMYELFKTYQNTAIWGAGINVDYWNFDKKINKEKVLVYVKNKPEPLYSESLKIISQKFKNVEFINYGKYNIKSYKEKLNSSRLAIFFSNSETQGIALAEAWSMNVPTFVWNQGIALVSDKLVATSSAPYLTEECGAFFKNINELEAILDRFVEGNFSFNPRQWVVSNMSEKISAQKLLELINY